MNQGILWRLVISSLELPWRSTTHRDVKLPDRVPPAPALHGSGDHALEEPRRPPQTYDPTIVRTPLEPQPKEAAPQSSGTLSVGSGPGDMTFRKMSSRAENEELGRRGSIDVPIEVSARVATAEPRAQSGRRRRTHEHRGRRTTRITGPRPKILSSKLAGIAAPVHPLVRDVNFKWILNSPSVFLVKRNHGRSQQAPRSTGVACPSYVAISVRRTRRPVAHVAAFGPLLGRDQPSGRMRRNRRASRAPNPLVGTSQTHP